MTPQFQAGDVTTLEMIFHAGMRVMEQDCRCLVKNWQHLAKITDDIGSIVTGVNDRQIHARSHKMACEVQVQSVRIDLSHAILKTVAAIDVSDLVPGQGIGYELTTELFWKRVYGKDARPAYFAKIRNGVSVGRSQFQDRFRFQVPDDTHQGRQIVMIMGPGINIRRRKRNLIQDRIKRLCQRRRYRIQIDGG